MKKNLFLAMFLVFAAAGASYAEFNLKTSYDLSGSLKIESRGKSKTYDVSESVTLAGEYLRRVGDFVKLGGGFEVVFPRTYDARTDDNYGAFFFLPLYFIAQVNPIPPAPEIFVKGQVGYNVIFFQADLENGASTKGGLYYGGSAGYEFPFGLLFDVTYAVYMAQEEYSAYSYGPEYTYDMTYSRIGINLGYKFGRPRKR